MAVNDAELAKDFTRVRWDVDGDVDGDVVEVAVLNWPHPHEPSLTWVDALTLPLGGGGLDLEAARLKVVKNRRFFALCGECGERQLKGHMYLARVCMACAERHHGVVF